MAPGGRQHPLDSLLAIGILADIEAGEVLDSSASDGGERLAMQNPVQS